MLSEVIYKIQSVMRHHELPKELAWMDTLVEMDELTALREITTQLTKIQFDQDVQLNRSDRKSTRLNSSHG